MHIKAYSILRVQLKGDKSAKGRIYTYKFMLIARQSQPHSLDEEMGRFGFCAAPSMICGGGGGSSVQESKIATLGASLCA